jgi:hypothetical protein
MSSSSSYLEKIQEQLKNIPIIAWIIIIIAILTALGSLYNTYRPIIESLMKSLSNSPKIRIFFSSFDPRFKTAGQTYNWGGNSQKLFLELKTTESNYLNEEELKTLILSSREREKLKVWEVVDATMGLEVEVNAVYSAAKEAPTCIIREWGVDVQKTKFPQNGILAGYLTGGASRERNSISVKIGNQEGLYPAQNWPERKRGYYLRPEEPFFLKVCIESQDTGSSEKSDTFGESSRDVSFLVKESMMIRIYTKVLIDGKPWTFKSADAMYVVILNKSDSVCFCDSDFVENLRPRAFIR